MEEKREVPAAGASSALTLRCSGHDRLTAANAPLQEVAFCQLRDGGGGGASRCLQRRKRNREVHAGVYLMVQGTFPEEDVIVQIWYECPHRDVAVGYRVMDVDVQGTSCGGQSHSAGRTHLGWKGRRMSP